jgi:amphi-Trp domain-containing protein
MSDDQKFKYEAVQDSQALVEYLQALTEGFAKGEMVFTQNQEQLVFKPRGMIGFTVKAEFKGNTRKLTLKFGWKEKETDDQRRSPLSILPGDEKED